MPLTEPGFLFLKALTTRIGYLFAYMPLGIELGEEFIVFASQLDKHTCSRIG
jgi:hypothetical protein